MEMTPLYMAETAEFLSGEGYRLTVGRAHYGEGALAAKSTRYELLRGEHQHFVLETVEHPEACTRYFLEVVDFFGMRAFSFPLDSWKFFDDRIEFKFVPVDATGLGLSFIIEFDAVPQPG